MCVRVEREKIVISNNNNNNKENNNMTMIMREKNNKKKRDAEKGESPRTEIEGYVVRVCECNGARRTRKIERKKSITFQATPPCPSVGQSCRAYDKRPEAVTRRRLRLRPKRQRRRRRRRCRRWQWRVVTRWRGEETMTDDLARARPVYTFYRRHVEQVL